MIFSDKNARKTGISFIKKIGELKMKKDFLKTFIDYIMLAVGAVIAAFAIEEFLVPNTILDGGVIGIGIMIRNLN